MFMPASIPIQMKEAYMNDQKLNRVIPGASFIGPTASSAVDVIRTFPVLPVFYLPPSRAKVAGNCRKNPEKTRQQPLAAIYAKIAP
jgi:hypothetical protein